MAAQTGDGAMGKGQQQGERGGRFVAAVEHADGYNGHTAVAYVVWDDAHAGLLAVYPHGWHACPNDLGLRALAIARDCESAAYVEVDCETAYGSTVRLSRSVRVF